MNIETLSIAFIFFTILITLVIASLMTIRLHGQDRATALVGLAVWLLYTGILGYLGVLGDASLMPPGVAYVVIPAILFALLSLARSDSGLRVAQAIPASMLIGMQSFRIIVELFLHELAAIGLGPRMLTYEGANFDILVGLTAPLVAWMLVTRRISAEAAIAWNFFGLAMLTNIVVRANLTAPGRLQLLEVETPDKIIGTFPFTFIPGLMVPLAIFLHVLSIRALRMRIRDVQNN